MKICFDMDGTLANLYGYKAWLEDLRAFKTTPYKVATPLINMNALAKELHRVQKLGHSIVIVSWGSKVSDTEYLRAVEEAKRFWLKKHLRSVNWDEINVVAYGTPKSQFKNGDADILFDDEEKNRIEWGNNAHDVHNIIEILKGVR